jgi:glycosyltransferase involved in cell wall biosynthesis
MKIGVAGPATVEPLADWLPSGVDLPNPYSFPYITELVVRYLQAGHEVDLYTCSEDIDERICVGDGPLRIFFGRRRASARARGIDFFRVERSDIREAIVESSPDVVHAHWLYEFSSAALDVHPDTLVTAHDSPRALIRHYHHPYWWLRATLGLHTLHRTKNLSVVSPSLLSETRLPRPAGRRGSLIPNGIGIPAAPVTPQTRRSRRERFVFATIANGFDGRKNTAVAIEAFAKSRRASPGAELLMFGRGHAESGEAQQWAQRRGLTDGVTFVGQIEHSKLIDLLGRDVDALVHPSKWEACSIAVLECIARGIPVIGGESSGGMPYTLGDGEAGPLVDISRPESLALAMLSIANNPRIYEEYSLAARKLAVSEFDMASVTGSYLQLLTEILEQRSSPLQTRGRQK